MIDIYSVSSSSFAKFSLNLCLLVSIMVANFSSDKDYSVFRALGSTGKLLQHRFSEIVCLISTLILALFDPGCSACDGLMHSRVFMTLIEFAINMEKD